jgi:hypothetical protein
MNPEVKIKISALDQSKAAFQSVEKSIDRVDNSAAGMRKRLESLQPTFKKMAAAGAVAFGAIAVGVGKMTQEAARAEGSWNKFNTVFGDGADDMRDWIGQIRKEMPLATHEIARMAADLQDLLVPMGLTRENAQDLTEGFVDLANKLAAFNDVDPTEVLEAFKSGLSGSSEPLRRFGINALDSSVELEALNTGLIETGTTLMDLDPITRSQIKAQALLSLAVKQSSDAVNGFEVNNDSLIRRQQALQATISELSVTLGTAFLPIIDDAVKAITPIIEKVAAWVEQNPELTRNIIIATAAIAGLIAVVGAIGIAMMALNPIGIIIVGAIAGISAIVYALTNTLKMFGLTWGEVWNTAKSLFAGFVNFTIGLAEGWANSWIGAVNMVIDALNSIQVSIPDWVPKIGGSSFGINIPKIPEMKIPRLAEGGIVTRSILANVGEAGPEAVIPLDRMSDFGSGTGGGMTIVNNFNGTFLEDRQAARRMGDEIMRTLQQQTRLA